MPGFNILEGMCCTAVQWPCCMSQACCDKWEEEALGNPDSGAGAATAATRFVGEVPSLMFTPRQEGALLARQGYAMMGMRGQQAGRQSMPIYNRGGVARQAWQEGPEYVAVPTQERRLRQF